MNKEVYVVIGWSVGARNILISDVYKTKQDADECLKKWSYNKNSWTDYWIETRKLC